MGQRAVTQLTKASQERWDEWCPEYGFNLMVEPRGSIFMRQILVLSWGSQVYHSITKLQANILLFGFYQDYFVNQIYLELYFPQIIWSSTIFKGKKLKLYCSL